MDKDQFKSFLSAFILCMAIMFGWQYFVVRDQPAPQPDTPVVTPAPIVTPAPAVTPAPPAVAPAPQPAAGDAVSTEMTVPPPPAPATGPAWKIVPVPAPAEPSPVVLGSRDPQTGYKAQIVIDPVSTGLQEVLLSEYKFKVRDEQTGYPLLTQARDERNVAYSSLMLGQMRLNGQETPAHLSYRCWTPEAVQTDANGRQTVRFTAVLTGGPEGTAVKVHKIYSYEPGNYELGLELLIENGTGETLTVNSIDLFGPVGIIREDPRSDRRMVTAAWSQAGNDAIGVARTEIAKLYDKTNPAKVTVTETSNKPVEWFGVCNKFFGAIVRPVYDSGAGPEANFFRDNRVRAKILNHTPAESPSHVILTQTNINAESVIAPGGQASYPMAVYLGPVDTEVFDQKDSIYARLQYHSLIYSPSCSMCTFDWLNVLILQVLKWVYGVVHNYGIAIIFLVLLVRFLLHPITKKSQINMQKMGKLGPRMEEVKKKYANNPQEMQRQTMALYKEQGWTPILGCLPMFLQMPIWIALFSAVDSNIAMRHKGLFPANFWLNDLSAPDRLIPFSLFGIDHPIQIPLLSGVDGFNLLPILLCIAMYLQSKSSMQTQAKAISNPQMEQQQKMMLYMMPLMMLIFFYSAPSGLNLYIMASTFGGLIEQNYIRKHLKELEAAEAEGKVATTSKIANRFGPKPKKPKPPIKFT